MQIDRIIGRIIQREGGFVDHPADRGGPTNYGITQRTLSEHLERQATKDEVRALTKDTARRIYRKQYVMKPGFQRIPDERLRAQVIDAGVLHGPGWAIRRLQEIVDVEVDGIIGPVTLKAINFDGKLDGLSRRFLARRLHKIARIVAHDSTQLVFLVGWTDRAMRAFLET